MKKTNKIMLTAALGTLCAGFAFGGVALFTASAEDVNFAIDGASVKYMTNETDSGIRFNFLFDADDFANLPAGATVNAALIPTDMVTEATATAIINADKALKTELPASVWKPNGEYMQSYAYLYDLPSVSYGRNISAVGYIVEDGEVTFTTAVETRSMAYVASAALYSTEYKPTASETQILNKYLENFDYGMTVENESKILLPVKAGSYSNEEQLSVKTNAPISITYESSNAGVAEVDANGKITAKASGDATITATAANGDEATYSVKVATPIDSKEDLDEIALAYQKYGSDSNWGVLAWSVHAYYVFTQDIDYKGERIIPIACLGTDGHDWGRWGVLSPGHGLKGNGFSGVMDGNGFAIENAVLSYDAVTWNAGGKNGNFIGYLYGTLKNLAFTNLVAEDSVDATGEDDGWNACSYQGIVGILDGRMENVFVDIYMKRGTISAHRGGVLAALVDNEGAELAVMKNCVAKVDGNSNSLVWKDQTYTRDFGLIAWTNVGIIENTFVVVAKGYHEQAMTSEIQYRDLFGGCYVAQNYHGVDNTSWKNSTMNNGTFTNLGRYTSVEALVSAHQANMGTYGYGAFWTNWLTPYMA